MAPLPVGQGSKEPARGGVLGVSSATSFFLEFPLARARGGRIFKNIGAVSARLESRYVRSPKAGRRPMPAAGVVIYFVEVSSSSPIPSL